MSRSPDLQVVVIGGGVVGAAVTHALAARGVAVALLEAEKELALAASGSNSGILHTGFDSGSGQLETELILRAAALRDPVLERFGVPVIRCGAVLRPRSAGETETVAAVAANAQRNGVEASVGEDGALEVPGECVTDPVAYTEGLAAAAAGGGAELRLGARVDAIEPAGTGLALTTADGGRLTCAVAVNCAGLRADEVARLVGDDSFEIYPRKGEFFVFDPPEGVPLERILLPVPTKRTKGVLVFPTVDGKVIAGPTAHDQEDKDDWSVRPEAWNEVMPKVIAMLPELEGAEPIASYAGLRPAGRDCNYVIGPAAANPRLINVAAIRSTGLTASLGIADHALGLVAEAGVELGEERELAAPEPVAEVGDEPWWRRAGAREFAAR
jgi:glycerol-3-phosphate dehydrogenase